MSHCFSPGLTFHGSSSNFSFLLGSAPVVFWEILLTLCYSASSSVKGTGKETTALCSCCEISLNLSGGLSVMVKCFGSKQQWKTSFIFWTLKTHCLVSVPGDQSSGSVTTASCRHQSCEFPLLMQCRQPQFWFSPLDKIVHAAIWPSSRALVKRGPWSALPRVPHCASVGGCEQEGEALQETLQHFVLPGFLLGLTFSYVLLQKMSFL